MIIIYYKSREEEGLHSQTNLPGHPRNDNVLYWKDISSLCQLDRVTLPPLRPAFTARYSQTNLAGLTLRPRIELVLYFDFVLLAPSLSTGPLSSSSSDLIPRRQCDFVLGVWLPLVYRERYYVYYTFSLVSSLLAERTHPEVNT